MNELAIPADMQTYLKMSFHNVLHFTKDDTDQAFYSNQIAPGRYKKELIIWKNRVRISYTSNTTF